MLLLRNKDQQQNNPLATFANASSGKGGDTSELQAHHCITYNREPDSCAVWVSYRQNNCHCKNQINWSELRCRLQFFPEVFGS